MKTRFSTLESILFPRTFARFESAKSGSKDGFYPGVLVIELGPAKGHFAVKTESGAVVNYDPADETHIKLQKYPIYIGESTLDDVVRCGNESDSAKCKLDHGSTVKDIIGDYVNFSRDGDKVRADLAVMDNTPHRAYVVELITKMSKKIGNSIDFDYVYEIQGSKAIARCVALNSVDIVDTPAATNSLFEKQTSTPQYDMPLSPEDLAAIGGVIDTKLSAHKAETDKQFSALKLRLEEGEAESDEDKKKREAAEKKEQESEGDTKMAAMIQKSTLAAVHSILPKAALANLANLGNPPAKDAYAEKYDAAIALGMSPANATRFMARTHPTLYTTKFGNGGGEKGSAKTTL